MRSKLTVDVVGMIQDSFNRLGSGSVDDDVGQKEVAREGTGDRDKEEHGGVEVGADAGHGSEERAPHCGRLVLDEMMLLNGKSKWLSSW